MVSICRKCNLPCFHGKCPKYDALVTASHRPPKPAKGVKSAAAV